MTSISIGADTSGMRDMSFSEAVMAVCSKHPSSIFTVVCESSKLAKHKLSFAWNLKATFYEESGMLVCKLMIPLS